LGFSIPAFLLSLSLAAPIAGQGAEPNEGEEVKLEGNPFADFETHFLSNGLKLWFKRLTGDPDMYVSAIVPYGSDWDPRGKEETAHFLEHMLFADHMGRTEEEILREIEDRGGRRFGSTWADHTTYRVAINNEHGMYALDWIYNVVSPHEMDPAVVERQRQPVAVEIRARPREFFDWIGAYVFDPPWLRMKGFWEREFGMETRPYRWYDRYSSLNAIGPEDLRSFYDTYYVPSRMTLVVVGDLDRDSVVTQVEATFGALPVRPAPQDVTELNDAGRYRQSIQWDFRPNVLYDTRFKVYDLDSEKHLNILFMERFLQYRLNQRLRFGDEKAVYGVSVYFMSRGPASYFRISAQIDEDKFEFAEGVIEEEFDLLRNGNLPPEEFEQARGIMVTRFIRESREPGVLGVMASNRFYDPDLHRDFPDLAGKFRAVSQTDLSEFARDLFAPERRVHRVVRRQPVSQGMFALLAIAVLALTVHLARWLMIRRIEMPRIRYVARFKRHIAAKVLIALVMAVLIAGLYRFAFQGIYFFYVRAIAPIDSYLVQYAFFSLCIVAGVLGIIVCLAFLPQKLLVFDDHLLVKYLAYRSRRIPFSELRAISTEGLFGFLRKGGPLRFRSLTLALFRPGVLLETTMGRGFFFRVRDAKELISTVRGLKEGT
jgi:zinc protease